MPPYLELCIATVLRHEPGAKVLDWASFEELWTTDLDVPVQTLGPHHRADFIRLWLLTHHGGAWLDCDVVLLRPLASLLPPDTAETFAGYREDSGSFANGLLLSRLGDRVVSDCYARVCDHLRHGRPVEWLELGAIPLTAATAAHAEAVREIDADMVCPIPWHQQHRFEETGDAAALVESPRVAVMLSNNSLGDGVREATREETLGGRSVLSDLLRRALA